MSDEEIVLDFDSILPPEGEYKVVISSIRKGIKKNAVPGQDYPYLEFHYSLMERTDGEVLADELVGYDVMDIRSLNPSARVFLQQVLEAFTCMPWTEKDMTVKFSDLIGMDAIAVVEHQLYNGATRVRASRIYNPDFVPAPKKVDMPSADVWEQFNSSE